MKEFHMPRDKYSTWASDDERSIDTPETEYDAEPTPEEMMQKEREYLEDEYYKSGDEGN